MSRLCCFPLAVALAVAGEAISATPEEIAFFERNIRPVLVEKCSACHGDQVQMAGLQLTTAEGFYKGGDTGPVFVKDDPEGSRLLAAVRYEGDAKMPPTGKLPDEEIEDLAKWIGSGAPWPAASVKAEIEESGTESGWTEEQRSHWAFRPVERPEPPPVNGAQWVQTPIDRFVLARLEQAGLAPPERADRLTLLRRATYDLHGLPPSEAEIGRFLRDKAAGGVPASDRTPAQFPSLRREVGAPLVGRSALRGLDGPRR